MHMKTLTQNQIEEIIEAVSSYSFEDSESVETIESENFIITAQQTIHTWARCASDHIIDDGHATIEVHFVETYEGENISNSDLNLINKRI